MTLEHGSPDETTQARLTALGERLERIRLDLVRRQADLMRRDLHPDGRHEVQIEGDDPAPLRPGSDIPTAGFAQPGPASAEEFARSVILAICRSGLDEAGARALCRRCLNAIGLGASARMVLRHAGKAEAIDRVWHGREQLFLELSAASDKLGYLGTLPWIGEASARRLAQCFGIEAADPLLERNLSRRRA